MKLQNDKIIFEGRWEIDEITDALETYASEHPEARANKSIKKLAELLDAMYMSW